MEKDRKIDLKQHTLPPVSKRYLLRILIYIVLLIVLGVLIYKLFANPKGQETKINEVEQINNITLDPLEIEN